MSIFDSRILSGLHRPLVIAGVALILAVAGCGQPPPKAPSSGSAPTQGAPAPTQSAPAPSTTPSGGSSQPAPEKPKAEAPVDAPASDQPQGQPQGQPKSAEKQATAPASDGASTRSLDMKKAKPPEASPQAPGAAAPPPPAPAPATATKTDNAPAAATKRDAAADNPMYDVVPVFYGTDRAIEPDPKRLAFGSERGHKLQLGRALVTVPLSHKVPSVERPWVVEVPYFKLKIYEEKEDNKKHFTLQEISALTKEQMLALVKERLAKSVNFKDHAFVFIHGFNTSFDYSLYRTAQIAYDLKFDGAPFVYSWPSGGKVASYTYDRGSAEQAEPHLAEFLDLVVKQTGAKSISLIAHSMGNELLLRVMEHMKPVTPAGVSISQVILAAPDVDRDKFNIIAREITSLAKGVTLYAASNDRALGYSARFWGGVPRAGDVPATGPLIVPGVDTIDVTSLSTDSLALNHSSYAENNALLNDIKLLLQTGERPPDKRIPILEKVTIPGGDYWRYPKVH